jgi:hypothetical protein
MQMRIGVDATLGTGEGHHDLRGTGRSFGLLEQVI